MNENGVDTIALLERALDQVGEIVAALDPAQYSLPTPCTEWDVRALVEHLLAKDVRNFIAAARGETVDWQAPPDPLGDDWAGAFRRGAEELLAAWRQADLDRPVPMPGGSETTLRARADQQITELAVHAWDLARATGRTKELDPEVAEHALAWSRGMLRPEFRGPDKAVGFEVPVAESAPVSERLAGWFGRDPAWRPGR